MKAEYKEGKEARENFDSAMKTIFSAPKTVNMSQPSKKRKSKTSADVDPASTDVPKRG